MIERSPAETTSNQALQEVYSCLEHRKSFLVEAGAGAGKTYTLVKALHFLIERYGHVFSQRLQKVACITFTNVAKDEIEVRTDRNPLIYCNTIHAFCWSLIRDYQQKLRELLPQVDGWNEKIAEIGDLGERTVEYESGRRSIKEQNISIEHDDVLALTIELMKVAKFRTILTSKYPVILIDEYQDTNANWVEAIKTYFLGDESSPQFGFFGDHWQKIYGDGCGKIEHPSLTVIRKRANFRSVSDIVNCLNKMRPELEQVVVDPSASGSVRVFHTNAWNDTRKRGGHWSGDLPDNAASRALKTVRALLAKDGWMFRPKDTKILMLTHRVLASNQGYPSMPAVFRYNESFTKKEHPHIAYFTEVLEPACEAYHSKKYGEMFRALGSKVPAINAHTDKKKWSEVMDTLIELRASSSVGNVIDHLLKANLPIVPDAVVRLERELREFKPESGEEESRRLLELAEFREVAYSEVIDLSRYLSGHSPFETQHGVKGAEFEDVLVVVGRGWSKYNFGQMLALAGDTAGIPKNRQAMFERNRNLFYVACSRPKKRLAILFTQKLSEDALQTVGNWFGGNCVESLDIQKTNADDLSETPEKNIE